jgi:hypothetical protein
MNLPVGTSRMCVAKKSTMKDMKQHAARRLNSAHKDTKWSVSP